MYLFAGSADRITSLEQLRPWYEALQAPSKHLEVVEQAGHLGLFEAAGRFTDFLSGVRGEVTGARP